MELMEPKNIIVRMPNWIGDAIMATPILQDLKMKWQDAKVTIMCQGPIGQLFLNNPFVDHIYTFEKKSGWIHRLHRSDIIEKLQEGHYDLGILLTNSLSSAWWFYRGNVKNRIGFKSLPRLPLLNKAVNYPENMEVEHQVITYKHLLEPLNIPISLTAPQLYLSVEERLQAENTLKNFGIDLKKNVMVGVNPGAAYGSAKCWMPERFQEVTKKLLENPDVYVIYFGDRLSLDLNQQICAEFTDRVINLAGKTTLRELIALINSCHIFLSNDSGPMHIAAALRVPLLALFGSTNATKTGPFPNGEVIHKHVECSPCYKRTCPIDFRCMTSITAAEVYKKLEKMIDET